MSEHTSPELLSYVHSLLEKRGIMELGLDPIDIEDMATDLYRDVETYIKEYLLSQLTTEESLVYGEKLKTESLEDAQGYLEAQLPDYPTILASALMDFEEHYLRM
ncbi:hypothetical protein COW46_02650 [Candidatus Gracilibacteria bacterium CG17_big_fil_post_rev_8_21_14_2_50_48_13]|nr:MAG: hypothetical protein COW46_02650 [Candidatus Gracilibacteria bacterium CG17_big_fil_post_rev_8_21_14_2_50_48_13]